MGAHQKASKAPKASAAKGASPERAAAGPARQPSVAPNPLWQQLATAPLRLQAKLTVGAPNDPYEREADQIADQVMRMPEPAVQRKCAACEEEETVRAKEEPGEVPALSPDSEARIRGLRGGGTPLPEDVRGWLEPRFGHDFSGVRVHAGPEAAETARSIHARAFTIGNDIVFGANELRPESTDGKRLLAHELTHTMQQTGGASQTVRRRYRLPEVRAAAARVGASRPRSEPSGTLRRIPLSERDLRQRRGIPYSFIQEVYRRQVAIWTGRGASYTHEIPAGDLRSLPASDVISGRSVQVHRDIETQVRALLRDARADLAAATGAGRGGAGVTGLAVRSGYRSATDQFSIWEGEFPRYYRDTQTARAALPGGEHGADAAQHLAEYVNERVFSPGYSPHQRGRTIDFSYRSAGEWPAAPNNWAQADTSAAGLATWESSWFFHWLDRNAARYGFVQNPALREPWHWEYNPGLAGLLELGRAILRLLRRLWRALMRLLGMPDTGDGEEEAPARESQPAEPPPQPAPEEPGQ